MTTGGPPVALSMRSPQRPITPVLATSPTARPGQATTALSHHPRSRAQRSAPPSKVARVLSWVARTKLYLGAAIGILTLIVTIVSLLSSFAGDRYSREALELALWTARKDYVEACQTYLNHTNVDCQQALEQGLPPPPGLDRLAARSLQELKDHVQWLEIQPLIRKTNDHVVWLRLWLQIGTIVVALILTGQWNRIVRLMRRKWIRPCFRDQAINLASSPRERKGKTIGESATLTAHSPSQATSTGISVEEGQATKLRRRLKTVASEAITVRTSDLADEHLRARNRAVPLAPVLPAGKERVEKKRRIRDREDTKWTKPVGLRSVRLNGVNSSPFCYLHTGYSNWDWYSESRPEYTDGESGYFCRESQNLDLDEVVDYYFGKVRPARRPFKVSKAVAAKQAQRQNKGVIPRPWPIPRRERRNPRKGKRGPWYYSHSLDESEAPDRFEDPVPF